MVRDPLYRAIKSRLGERLGPERFERCAVELLRDVYPGLVPIPGGDDGGMDGAISIGEPAAIPLVVTAGKDVLGNLKRNLDSYLSTGGLARQAVLATSQPLTPTKRRNLEKRAREKGFTLRNIHDRADLIGRLYRSPSWRLELLGLLGHPPALSALPDQAGSRWRMRLIGRDREMAWLGKAEGNAIVVGQPGVGKTALLEAFAREGGGLFVVSDDMGRIADAYREEQPERVFVDDAHLKDSLVARLTRLREQIGARFAVVATAWPGHEDDLRRELRCSPGAVLSVGGLDRTTAAGIVGQVNSAFSDELVGEILNQSVDDRPSNDPRTPEYHAGGHVRPGLAVTLARAVVTGGVSELVTGRLLLSELRRDARLGEPDLDCLGAFALGGAAGMPLPGVARALTVPETDVRQALLRVSGTGVLREVRVPWDPGVRESAAAIHPAHLRIALVARTFFSGVAALTLEPVLNQAVNAKACTETLMGVLARLGSSLDEVERERLHGLIRLHLRKQKSPFIGHGLWASYARTGAKAAGWILEEHPAQMIHVAGAVLRVVPEKALGHLLSRVLLLPEEAEVLGRSIRAWVTAGFPGDDAANRREHLVRELAQRARDGDLSGLTRSTRSTVSQLLDAAFSLSFEETRDDPVKITTIRFSFGSLPAADVRQVADLWTKALPVFRALGREGLACARNVVDHWLHESGERDDFDRREATCEGASRMLPGVIDLAGGGPGILLWANRVANAHGLDVGLPGSVDSALCRLFPDPREVESWSTSGGPLDAAASAFARKWLPEGPQTVVGRMMRHHHQGQLMGYDFPSVLEEIPLHLAQHVDDPAAWLEELVERGAPQTWVLPFLEAAALLPGGSGHAWEIVARDRRYDRTCVRVGLGTARPPDRVVDIVMERATTCPNFLYSFIRAREVADEWKHRLLRHPDRGVRGRAARGVWEVDGKRRPGGRLGVAWEDAVLACGDPGLMSDVLGDDPDIGRAWILAEADRDEPALDEELLSVVVGSLGMDDRRELARAISDDADPKFRRYLLEGDPDP